MEIAKARDAVTTDIEKGLSRWLPAGDDEGEGLQFGLAGNLEGADEATSFVAVQWVYRGRNKGDHDFIGPFIGLFPTDDVVEVHGVTLVEDRGGEPLFHRYVDWVGVYDQLGLAVSTRLPIPEHPGHIGPPPHPDS